MLLLFHPGIVISSHLSATFSFSLHVHSIRPGVNTMKLKCEPVFDLISDRIKQVCSNLPLLSQRYCSLLPPCHYPSLPPSSLLPSLCLPPAPSCPPSSTQDGPNLVKKVRGSFLFKVTASDGSLHQWLVDLKNGNGSVTKEPGMAGVQLPSC